MAFLVGLSIAGYYHENNQLAAHSQAAVSFWSYVVSGNFLEAVFENWESEFLQMGALVVLTIWLRQKGSHDSKKLRGRENVDTASRYSIIHGSWKNKGKAIGEFFYGNSLGVMLFLLFFASLALHVASGVDAHNQEALQHGQQQLSVLGYVASAQFWFESFQNWQSEFLAVGVLIVLSIFLHQRHSPESKPVGEPNMRTGAG